MSVGSLEAETHSQNPKVSMVARKTLFLQEETLSRTGLTGRNNPAESQLGKGEEGEGDRAERIRERERNTTQ